MSLFSIPCIGSSLGIYQVNGPEDVDIYCSATVQDDEDALIFIMSDNIRDEKPSRGALMDAYKTPYSLQSRC
jgi:hypothetical protein